MRAHWTERDPAKLWQTYVQLTEAEAAFRTLKSELGLRPMKRLRDEIADRSPLDLRPIVPHELVHAASTGPVEPPQ